MISIKDLYFEYNKQDKAINGISLDILEGKWVSIVGHNGSGKSTLSKLLIGLHEPTSGSITVDGLKLDKDNVKEIRKKIGIVFQNPDNQFVGVTVKHDIAFGLENRRYSKSDMDKIIEESAFKVSMIDYLDKEPHTLSGGQKQRVSIAGVLALDCDYIIFDEATSMLDPKGVEDISSLIQEIKNTTSKTIITITHDLNLAALSDEIVVLNKGVITSRGLPSEVFMQKDILNNSNLDMPYNLKLYTSILEDKELSKREELVNLLCKLSLTK